MWSIEALWQWGVNAKSFNMCDLLKPGNRVGWPPCSQSSGYRERKKPPTAAARTHFLSMSWLSILEYGDCHQENLQCRRPASQWVCITIQQHISLCPTSTISTTRNIHLNCKVIVFSCYLRWNRRSLFSVNIVCQGKQYITILTALSNGCCLFFSPTIHSALRTATSAIHHRFIPPHSYDVII